MKKLSLAIIIGTISISLVGCTNPGIVGIGNNSSINNSVNNKSNNKITIEQAKEIALKHAGLTKDQVLFFETKNDVDSGLEKYDIEFYCNGKEYDYEISAIDGSIINYDNDIKGDTTQNNNDAVAQNNNENTTQSGNESNAESNSQNNAQNNSVNTTQNNSVNTAPNNNANTAPNNSANTAPNNSANTAQNNRVNTASNNSANTAQNNIQSNTNNTGGISLDKAKEIALSHAGLSSNQVTFVQAKRDFDHGIAKYEIEFYCNGKEYDYEINATTGQIIKYDYDMEYNYIPNNTPSNTPSNNQGNVNNTSKISAERAKEIALSHAGLSSNQVTFKKTELDFDDGIAKYEIEFYYNYREYSYEINANNGTIVSFERD